MGRLEDQLLLGDIGGTNARFALFGDAGPGRIQSVQVSDYPNISAAIESLLARHAGSARLSAILLATAGPVEGNRCELTNSAWVIDGAELRDRFELTYARVVNDFEAIAWSLPHLTASDLFGIGRGKAVWGTPAVVLGPGTGFGLAGIVHGPQGIIAVTTEGGHATLPSTSRREDEVIQHLRERYGHVSVERVLSGPGLHNLYEAIGAVVGIAAPTRSAPEIMEAGRDGRCAVSRAALDMFCAVLGTVAGNVAVSFGARGGIYIAGGIVPRIVEYVTGSQFRDRFEAKGRFRTYLAPIPTYVIVHPDPAFVGLKSLMPREISR